MKKLLILGGSNCQINAFKRAKQKGLQTVLFDYLPSPPAALLATQHVQASTFNPRACLAEARKIMPHAVMTLGTDQPVYTAALIAEKLGLPTCITTQQALAVTNKAVMKKTLTENSLPTLPYAIAGKADLESGIIPGEVVIKPMDSQGQKGVFRAGSAQQAAQFFDEAISYSRCQKLICESYYPSGEVTVSAWVHKGKAATLTITDRVTIEHHRHIGVCAAHRYPSVYAAGRTDEIEELTRRIAAAFNIQEGPLYIQFLIGKNGVMVNELACRIGGAFEDASIPAVTGFDILGAAMDAALEGKFTAVPQGIKGAYGSFRVLLPFAKSGRLCKLTPLQELCALPFVLDAGYNFAVGDVLPRFENAGARLGHMVLVAKTEEEMQQNLCRFYKTFYALDENGKNLLLEPPVL